MFSKHPEVTSGIQSKELNVLRCHTACAKFEILESQKCKARLLLINYFQVTASFPVKPEQALSRAMRIK